MRVSICPRLLVLWPWAIVATTISSGLWSLAALALVAAFGPRPSPEGRACLGLGGLWACAGKVPEPQPQEVIISVLSEAGNHTVIHASGSSQPAPRVVASTSWWPLYSFILSECLIGAGVYRLLIRRGPPVAPLAIRDGFEARQEDRFATGGRPDVVARARSAAVSRSETIRGSQSSR